MSMIPFPVPQFSFVHVEAWVFLYFATGVLMAVACRWFMKDNWGSADGKSFKLVMYAWSFALWPVMLFFLVLMARDDDRAHKSEIASLKNQLDESEKRAAAAKRGKKRRGRK